MANIKNAVKLGVFTLAIMNVTAVVSLRGLPAEAVYGMSSTSIIFCSYCLPYPYIARCSRVGGDVSG